MQATAREPEEARSNPSILPAFAMFLMIGAAAIVQPHAKPSEPSGLGPRVAGQTPTVQAATVRIVLPPPAPLAPRQKPHPTGTVRLLLRDLGPVTPPPAALAASSVEAPPLSALPSPIENIAAAPAESAALGRQDGNDIASFSATMSEITASLTAASDPRKTRTTRTGPQMDDLASTSPSGTDRTTALVSSSSPRADPLADPLAGPSNRAQMILTEAMTPKKKRSIASVSLKVSATVNGGAVGRVALLIDDAENIQVRLSDLLAILEPAIEPALFSYLSESQAAQSYMTLNDLRAAGIKVRFDENDRLVINTPEK